jgi:hypothetical protein
MRAWPQRLAAPAPAAYGLALGIDRTHATHDDGTPRMEDALLRERRAGDRVPFAIQVMVVLDELAWAADVLDLSEGGCGIFRPKGCMLREGNVARLLFFQGPGPAVSVSARIARVTERHIGFEYHELQTIPPSPP